MTKDELFSFAEIFTSSKSVMNKVSNAAIGYIRSGAVRACSLKPDDIVNDEAVQSIVYNFCNKKKYAYVDDWGKQNLCSFVAKLICGAIHQWEEHIWLKAAGMEG